MSVKWIHLPKKLLVLTNTIVGLVLFRTWIKSSSPVAVGNMPRWVMYQPDTVITLEKIDECQGSMGVFIRCHASSDAPLILY